MEGIKINRVTLYLGILPTCKSLCFYFEEDNVLVPVAYVSAKHAETAKRLWQKMMDGIPEKDSKQ